MTIEEISEIPELRQTPFPFNGKPDFRGFTQEDYFDFVGGVFQKIPNSIAFGPQDDPDGPRQCKWIGGRNRFGEALRTLLLLGLDLTIKLPHMEIVGNSEETWRVHVPWYTIRWTMPR